MSAARAQLEEETLMHEVEERPLLGRCQDLSKHAIELDQEQGTRTVYFPYEVESSDDQGSSRDDGDASAQAEEGVGSNATASASAARGKSARDSDAMSDGEEVLEAVTGDNMPGSQGVGGDTAAERRNGNGESATGELRKGPQQIDVLEQLRQLRLSAKLSQARANETESDSDGDGDVCAYTEEELRRVFDYPHDLEKHGQRAAACDVNTALHTACDAAGTTRHHLH
jgi:hypothetical protein